MGSDAVSARIVGLSFHPPPAVRELTIGEYCLNGPYATPHVIVQQILAPGEERAVAANLPAGPYRLRTLEAGGGPDIDHAPQAAFPPDVLQGGAGTARAPPP